MTVRLLGLSICALSISGCFHDDSANRQEPPLSGFVTGEKSLFGTVMHVSARYGTSKDHLGNDAFDGDAGADEVFLTSDDTIVGYDAQEGVGDAPRKNIHAISRGQDGLWFTDDDELSSYYQWEAAPDGAKAECLFITAGNDGKWLTGDDVRDFCDVTTATPIGAGGRHDKTVRVNAAGNDGKWLTGDDVISTCAVTTTSPVDGGGRREKLVGYKAEGPDGIWCTSDDIVGANREWLYDSASKLVEWSGSFGAGNDGIWNTVDDEGWASGSYRTLSYDAGTNTRVSINTTTYTFPESNQAIVHSNLSIGQTTQVTFSKFGGSRSYQLDSGVGFSSPGNDGEWLTPDDALPSKVSTEILEQSETALRSRTISWLPGANGAMGDADDTVRSYILSTVKIDDNSAKETREAFGGPGPDGAWLTDDDELVDKGFNIDYWPGRSPSE